MLTWPGCLTIDRPILARLALLAGIACLAAASLGASSDAGWQPEAPLPAPRSEVAGALFGGRIAVVGGLLSDGGSSRRVDVYDPAASRWTRLPGLPLPVNHAMAAAGGARLYVVGGYAEGEPSREAFVLEAGRWLRLPPLPAARAAGGAPFAGGKLCVVGGVGPSRTPARMAFVFDPRAGRWSTIPRPTPREHLSAGGEEPGGTIASVYAYDPAVRRWTRLPNLRTPRHGLAVVGRDNRVYAVAGGPAPGLSVSGANEVLTLP